MRQPALRPAVQPGAHGVRRARTTRYHRAPRATRAIPFVAHHLPAHRAPHGGRDEPLAAVARRAAAGDVRARSPRSWPPSAGSGNGGWATIATARGRDRGPGAGDAAHPAAPRAGPASSTRSGCRTTGAAARPGDAATRPTTSSPSWPTPTSASRSPRRSPATSAAGRRPARRAALAGRAGRGPPAADPRRDRRAGPEATAEGAHDVEHGEAPRGRGDAPMRRQGLLHRHHASASAARRARSACKQWNQLPDDGHELHRHELRQHRRARRLDLAPRGVRRALRAGSTPGAEEGGRPRPGSSRRTSASTASGAGCLETCPTGAHRPHRVRDGLRPARHLQRLRLLRRRRARSGSSTAARRTGAPGSARSATTAPARAWSRRAPRPARPSRSSSATSTSCASAPPGAWTSCSERGVAGAYLYGADPGTQPGTEGLHAFFLLADRPEVYNLPPDPWAPAKRVGTSWRAMAAAGAAMALAALAAVASAGGRS